MSRFPFPRIRAPSSDRCSRRAARVLVAHQSYKLAEGSGLRLMGSKPPSLRFLLRNSLFGSLEDYWSYPCSYI
jgi:hypothetical protein